MTGRALDFGTITAAGAASTILRSPVVYLAIRAALRLAGKRHVGQLSIVDFVLVLLVSNAVQNAMVGSDSSLARGIATIGAWGGGGRSRDSKEELVIGRLVIG